MSTTELLVTLFDGRLRLERRTKTKYISARTFIAGKMLRKSTKETTEGAAKKVATDWYKRLLAMEVMGQPIHDRTFADVAEKFLTRMDQVKEIREQSRLSWHVKWGVLKPLFGTTKVTAVTRQFLTDLRSQRAAMTTNRGGTLMPSTLHKDMVFISLVLKHARDFEKCLETLPTFPRFSGDMAIHPNPRPYLSYKEYQHLEAVALQRTRELGLPARAKQQRREVRWFVHICVGAALRPSEAASLIWKHCKVVTLKDKTKALEMLVWGKHGKGRSELAHDLFHAPQAFQQMAKARPDRKPDDHLFRELHRDSLRELFEAAGLRTAADGRTRDAKSFRPTGISLQIEVGKSRDFHDIARWVRTSPAMVHRFYDQNSPRQSVERLSGYRERDPVQPKKQNAPPVQPPALDPAQRRYDWETDDESDE